jgi:hypothetical protein
VVFALATAQPAAAAAVTKETFTLDRGARTYYLFIPDSIGAEPAPVIITLHGSGRDGRPLVDLFRDVASKQKFIVVGPDATDRRGWQVPADGPAFLYFLIDAVKTKHAIDGRRVYLFGHSAGADTKQPRQAIVSELATAVVQERRRREGGDQRAQHAFDDRFRDPPQQEQADRNADDRIQHQGHGAAQVYLPPVARGDGRGDRNRDQRGDRCRDLHRQRVRQERHGDQRVAEPERRSHEGGEEEHADDDGAEGLSVCQGALG